MVPGEISGASVSEDIQSSLPLSLALFGVTISIMCTIKVYATFCLSWWEVCGSPSKGCEDENKPSARDYERTQDDKGQTQSQSECPDD